MTDRMTVWSSLLTELEAHRPDPRRGRTPVEATGIDTDRRAVGPTSEVPVTLLTGFLGAGKSSLLVALLASAPDGMIVRAVVNDVGSLPLDPTLVADGSAAEAVEVELTNGCGCCSTGRDLRAALERVAPGSDLIILEASGIADPIALGQLVDATDAVHLDRVVAVVDACAAPYDTGPQAVVDTVRRQLDAAEVIIVSRADVVDADGLAEVVHHVTELAPGRMIVASSPAEPESTSLLPGSPRGARPPVGGRVIDHGFVAITVEIDRCHSREVIVELFARRPQSIVRCKGQILVDGCPGDGAELVAIQVTPGMVEPMIGNGPVTAGRAAMTIVATDRADLDRFVDTLKFGPPNGEDAPDIGAPEHRR